MIYYNEFDPFAAEWLRQLMKAGQIPQGDIDTRSITEVKADDIRHYTQCHFFAGIAGWSEALRLANWPTDRPVWTGSCPCQPFSSAGNQKGKADERHLWPVWFNLIRECRPATIFGEQVSTAIAHGWLDDVYQGLEAEGYACGSAVLPACSVGAPHKRDRLFFVANACCEQFFNERPTENIRPEGGVQRASREQRVWTNSCEHGEHICDVANSENAEPSNAMPTWTGRIGITGSGAWDNSEWIDCPDGKQRLIEPGICLLANGVPNRVGKLCGYGNAIVPAVGAAFIQAFLEVENV